MTLHGFQPMTLLDYPQKVACTLFTAGCNMRCPFCHNASLVTNIGDPIDEREVLATLEKRRGLLDGVCITGGEPTLQPDLSDFIARIKAMGYAVKLDTNGTHPDRIAALLDAHLLDYVAMDVKNAPAAYPRTVGIPGYDIAPIEESLRLLQASGIDHEFRTTVVRELHAVEDIVDAARWIARTGDGGARYYLQQFVDSGDTIAHGLSAHTPDTLREMARCAAPYVQECSVRGV